MLVLLFSHLCCSAQADPVALRFDMPRQPLAAALNQFALRTGRDILFLPRLTAGLSAPALRGVYSPETALTALLAETGLTYRPLRTTGVQPVFLIEKKTTAPPNVAVLDEVVVTATRTATLNESTPLSVVVLSASEVQSNRTQLGTLGYLLPSLTTSRTSSAETHRYTVRGVIGPGESTTGLYYNDLSVSGPTGTTADAGMASPELRLIDIQRVELLRGPQGTLYGAGAMGGALRVLFNEPEFDRSSVGVVAEALQRHSHLAFGTHAVLNTPLSSDRAALRLVAYHDRTPGHIDNTTLSLRDVNIERTNGARVALRTGFGRANISLLAARQTTTSDDSVTWSMAAGPFVSTAPVRLPFDNRFALYNARIDWQLASSALRINAGYQSWQLTRRYDYTDYVRGQRGNAEACARFASLPPGQLCTAGQLAAYTAYVDAHTPALLEQPMSTSTRIVEGIWRGDGERVSWSTGIYLEDRRDTASSIALAADAQSGIVREPREYLGERVLTHRLQQQALFGEIQLPLFGDAMLASGARWYRFEKSGIASIERVNYLSAWTPGDRLALANDDDGLSLKFNLSRDWRGTLLYAQAAQGFRPGGVNFNPGLSDAALTYRADSLWNYEIGAKSVWLDRTLSLDASVYLIDWRDMQYTMPTGNSAGRFLANVGRARGKGVELDARWLFTDGWRTTLSAAYTDIRLVESQRFGAAVGLGERGDRLPIVPHWRASAGLQYEHAIGNARLNAQTNVNYNSSAFTGFASTNAEFARLDEVALIDARVSLQFADSWNVTLFGANLTNRRANTSVLNNLGGPPQASGPPPRGAGVSIEWRAQ